MEQAVRELIGNTIVRDGYSFSILRGNHTDRRICREVWERRNSWYRSVSEGGAFDVMVCSRDGSLEALNKVIANLVRIDTGRLKGRAQYEARRDFEPVAKDIVERLALEDSALPDDKLAELFQKYQYEAIVALEANSINHKED